MTNTVDNPVSVGREQTIIWQVCYRGGQCTDSGTWAVHVNQHISKRA